MAITKINTPELFDLGTTNSSLRLPSGDTASRPSNPNRGEWRYNTDDNYVEYWDGNAWFQIDYETVAPTCTTNTINYPTAITAYYKMEDATDQTGNYNGTATNVNFNVAGKFGNAGEFNGSSSFVALPFFNFVSGSSANFTASLWFNVTDMSGGNNLIQLSGSSATNSSFNVQLLPNGTLRIDSYGAAYAFSGLPTVSTNNWYNLVLVNAGGTCTPYLNGSAGNVLTHNISFSGSYSNLGARYVLGSLYTPDITTGKIDQVRIFPSALTSDQVTQLYNEVQCAPTIVPADNFTAITYTGNSGTQSTNSLLNQVGSVDFQPDLVWLKSRSAAYSHRLFDSVRGATKRLISNSTSEETTETTELTSFDTNGFTVGNNIGVNENTQTYVAWCWKAVDTTTNIPASGSQVAADVRANTDAGFSIVKYTFSSPSTSQTVPHGLSSAPEMIITKCTSTTGAWYTYHKDVGTGKYLVLDSTAAAATYANGFSTVDATAWQQYFRSDAQSHVAYCFHSVDGMSKIGSYVGTGAAGNTIVTGFRPAFVMIKASSATTYGHWIMFDNRRDSGSGFNPLYADLSNAEGGGSGSDVDFNSNGFTLNLSPFSTFNGNGVSYIFLAIAEEVFVADNFFNDDSTVATYKLDGDAGDDSGNGYNGVATNVTYAAGKFDEAAVFNGINSYVKLNSLTTNNTSDYTFSFWCRNVVAPSSGYSLFITSTVNDYIYLAVNPSGQLIYYFDNYLDPVYPRYAPVLTTTGVDLSTSEWKHVVFRIEMSTGVKIYVNNIEVLNYAQPSTLRRSVSEGTSAVIGAAGPLTSAFLNGEIDQVRIFDRALDSGEVEQLYNE